MTMMTTISQTCLLQLQPLTMMTMISQTCRLHPAVVVGVAMMTTHCPASTLAVTTAKTTFQPLVAAEASLLACFLARRYH